MHTVTLSFDVEARDAEEAALMFLAALVSADWSAGMVLTVETNPGLAKRIRLSVDEVEAALRGGAS